MAIAKYVKTPREDKRYQIDYSNWLDTGEAVQSVVFTVSPVTVPPLVIDNVQVRPDTLGVQYYASGGVDGTTYAVIAGLTTTASSPSQAKEDEIIFVVREPQ
jgi:hypothetical protein